MSECQCFHITHICISTKWDLYMFNRLQFSCVCVCSCCRRSNCSITFTWSSVTWAESSFYRVHSKLPVFLTCNISDFNEMGRTLKIVQRRQRQRQLDTEGVKEDGGRRTPGHRGHQDGRNTGRRPGSNRGRVGAPFLVTEPSRRRAVRVLPQIRLWTFSLDFYHPLVLAFLI